MEMLLSLRWSITHVSISVLCQLNKLQLSNFTLFSARDSQTLAANIKIVLGSLVIPFTLTEEDQNACNGLIDASCPVYADKPLRYGLELVVDAPITGVTVELEFFLTDDSGERSMCFRYSQTISA